MTTFALSQITSIVALLKAIAQNVEVVTLFAAVHINATQNTLTLALVPLMISKRCELM
jgi:hypothetical protein